MNTFAREIEGQLLRREEGELGNGQGRWKRGGEGQRMGVRKRLHDEREDM